MSSSPHSSFVEDLYHYKRRVTREVTARGLGIGGNNPIRVQSMITSDTRDTEACIAQTLELARAGCELVRITAQTKKIACNLEHIVKGIRQQGCEVPIVADIHFMPNAAFEAAKWVDKIRVNPGNYADKKKFAVLEYTDQEYAAELERIEESFRPLVEICKDRGLAMRIGTNHGSLSDRIMNRYGDTPLGMVESALEFARIARAYNYHNFVFSMKASNPKVMIEAYRLLASKLNEEGSDWNYPLHLGVTEAGDGEDGRIKSAIGIGSLLADGIGDTIRVSLTEDAIHEIPVAKALIAPLENGLQTSKTSAGIATKLPAPFSPFQYERRASKTLPIQGIPIGGGEVPRVFLSQEKWDKVAPQLEQLGEYQPECILETSPLVAVDPRNESEIAPLLEEENPVLVTVKDHLNLPVIAAFRLLAKLLPAQHPILLKDTLLPCSNTAADPTKILLNAATNLGSLLCDGIGDAVLIQGDAVALPSLRAAYNILQASGTRIFKTDYVACPSCGRTLFNLQETTQKIRAATGHLKGVRIAIMGCIVNGPGEMADADFGYVGGAPKKINLYVGKKAVKFNIPEEEAVERLKDLIAEHGRWIDPA